jgi:hypothetical protein
MFERFTDRARRVLVLAQEEARLLNHNFMGTEHILLGLIHEGNGVAAKALESLGIGLEGVREKVEETIGPTGSPTTGSPPFTPRAKHVLELSLREALQLGHNYIGTEHLLLGLVREGEGVAARVLVSLGVDLSTVRQQVIELLSGYQWPEDGARWRVTESRAGPRCPGCRSRLDGHVGYRILPVPPAGKGEGSEPIQVVFVYCLKCGVVIAHTEDANTTERLYDPATRSVTLVRPTGTDPLRTNPYLRAIAGGVTPQGVRWTLTVGGSDESYSTMLRTEDGDGVIDSGGMGGPKLWGEDRLNVYTGINPDRGPRNVAVRCDPSIVRLVLEMELGADVELTQCGDGMIDGLRFGVAFVAPDAQLREIVGLDRDGSVVERRDLRRHRGGD